ncbi:putative addiction module killer protein [Yersinia intermedia]|nr:putative addiction module killer protein [Yersinia intermedia]
MLFSHPRSAQDTPCKSSEMERDGVWELRIDYGPGYRVHYAFDNKKIILLLIGGDKTTQDKDLDKAVTFWRDYQAR